MNWSVVQQNYPRALEQLREWVMKTYFDRTLGINCQPQERKGQCRWHIVPAPEPEAEPVLLLRVTLNQAPFESAFQVHPEMLLRFFSDQAQPISLWEGQGLERGHWYYSVDRLVNPEPEESWNAALFCALSDSFGLLENWIKVNPSNFTRLIYRLESEGVIPRPSSRQKAA